MIITPKANISLQRKMQNNAFEWRLEGWGGGEGGVVEGINHQVKGEQ